MKKIILLRVLIIIACSIYITQNDLYVFLKNILKYLKYIYYNIYYNNNFLKVNF